MGFGSVDFGEQAYACGQRRQRAYHGQRFQRAASACDQRRACAQRFSFEHDVANGLEIRARRRPKHQPRRQGPGLIIRVLGRYAFV
jgi:hypothetical protein